MGGGEVRDGLPTFEGSLYFQDLLAPIIYGRHFREVVNFGSLRLNNLFLPPHSKT